MANDNKILLKIFDILTPLLKEGQQLGEDTRLIADLGLDSMQVMQLLSTIEDEFDISVPLNVVPEVQTVKELVQQVQKLLGTG